MNEASKDFRPAIAIIGVGNDYRRDDAAGLIVARRLNQAGLSGVRVIEASGEGASLMEAWKDTNTVFLIDAVQSGAEPGTIHCLNASAQAIPASLFHCSTHVFGVAEAIELARALHRLPPRFILYGIEGANFGAGTELSTAVISAAEETAQRILAELQTGQFPPAS